MSTASLQGCGGCERGGVLAPKGRNDKEMKQFFSPAGPGPKGLENRPFISHDSAFSRLRPSFEPVVVPPKQREQGMPGVWLARSLVRKSRKHTSKPPQVRRNDPAFPAQWLYDLFRALSGDRAFLSPSPAQRVSVVAGLTPASRRQDHAALSSASGAFVWCATCGHRLPRPTSVTIAIRPSWWARDARKMLLICPTSQAELPATD